MISRMWYLNYFTVSLVTYRYGIEPTYPASLAATYILTFTLLLNVVYIFIGHFVTPLI